MMLSAEICQLPFDDGVQLLNTEHLIQTFQKLKSQILREGEGGGHLQQGHLRAGLQYPQTLQGVGKVEAAGGQAPAGLRRGCIVRLIL